MAVDRDNRSENYESETRPPFWLRDDEEGRRLLEARVVKIARENWPWAYQLAKDELHDGTGALEIVEFIAIEVSKRLRMEPTVGLNLSGYFRTAYIHRVRALAARNGRMRYEGTPHDVEANHRLASHDWFKLFEDRMVLKALLSFATEPVRRILHYRLLDYSWKQIAMQLGISEKQAKSRFYYGVQQAREELGAIENKQSPREDSAP